MTGNFLLPILLLVAVPAPAQSTNTQMGARAAGLANASACLADEWSLMNNPAGVAAQATTFAATAAEVRAGLEGANRIAFALGGPVPGGAGAFGVFRFGDSFYNEQIASGGWASHIGITSVGLKLSYVQYHAEGFSNRSALAASVGVITKLTKALTIGAYITNISQARISQSGNEQLPVRLTAGITYRSTDQFLFALEIQKDLDYNPVIKAGVEFTLHKALVFRTGFNLHPETAFLGLGLRKKKLNIDYSIQYTSELGAAHQISVAYMYAKNTKP